MTIKAAAFAAHRAHNLPTGWSRPRGDGDYDPPNFSWPAARMPRSSRWTRRRRRALVRYVASTTSASWSTRSSSTGQVHGGITQGIATALYEEGVYDEDGNLLTANIVTYLVPSAAELPSYELDADGEQQPDQPARASRAWGRRHDRRGARRDQRRRRRARTSA
jgi:carbon-monoxide dehydrogenase large subunit